MILGDIGTTLTTAFAGVAALGSAGAAGVMYQQWRASQTPRLSVDVVAALPSRRMFLSIANYGGAVKKTKYTVIESGQACYGWLPPNGYLAPGATARLRLGVDLPDDHQQVAIVSGFDLDGTFAYAWAANGEWRRWRIRGWRPWHRRARRGFGDVEMLQTFYPDAPDPTTLELRSSTLLPPDGTAAGI